MKIAWAITGGGHFLEESFDTLSKLKEKHELALFVSDSAEEVIKAYGLEKRLSGYSIIYESAQSPSFPACGSFMRGEYDFLIISPATANTVAKLACGIADSLVSVIFAHATKVRTPVLVAPTDARPAKARAPDGETMDVYPRNIDKENIKRLGEIEGVKILKKPEDALKFVK